MNHILNEIARRLPAAGPEQIDAIARAVGIDCALAADPPPSIEEAAPAIRALAPWEGEVVRGEIPFELKLSALGHEATQTCRAVYSATLTDDMDRKRDDPIRILCQVEMNWQILDWRDRDRVDEETGERPLAQAPVWTDDFEGLLPAAVPELILGLIEEQARALAASQCHSGSIT